MFVQARPLIEVPDPGPNPTKVTRRGSWTLASWTPFRAFCVQARGQLFQPLQLYRELGELGPVAYVLDRMSFAHLLSGELEQARQISINLLPSKDKSETSSHCGKPTCTLPRFCWQWIRPVEAERVARQSLESTTTTANVFPGGSFLNLSWIRESSLIAWRLFCAFDCKRCR